MSFAYRSRDGSVALGTITSGSRRLLREMIPCSQYVLVLKDRAWEAGARSRSNPDACVVRGRNGTAPRESAAVFFHPVPGLERAPPALLEIDNRGAVSAAGNDARC